MQVTGLIGICVALSTGRLAALQSPPRSFRSQGCASVGLAAYRFIAIVSRPPAPGASRTRKLESCTAIVRPSVDDLLAKVLAVGAALDDHVSRVRSD